MIIIKGKYLNENHYKAKNDYKVDEISVLQDGAFVPTIIQVSKDFVYPTKKDGQVSVEVPVIARSWDEKAQKYTPKGIKYYSYSTKPLKA